MDIEEISELATVLPEQFEPLLLTFYANPTAVEDGIVVGSDYGTRLILDPATGAIESVDPEGALPDRFFNSSVGQLARCIQAYAAYLDEMRGAPDGASANHIFERLRAELAAIDGPCVAHPEHWWSVVLEQIEDGLL